MLATVQFTVAVDFVIMMPLGPQLMRIFGIDTPAFNFVVHPNRSKARQKPQYPDTSLSRRHPYDK